MPLSFDDLIPQGNAPAQAAPPAAQSGSLSFDDLIPQKATPSKTASTENNAPDIATDMAKALPTGFLRGAIGLVGSPGDVSNLATSLLPIPQPQQPAPDGWYGRLVDTLNKARGAMELPTSGDIQKKVEGVTGPLYEAKTVPGQYAQTVGEFAPAALGGGGGLAERLATRTVLPAAASETAGQATKGTALEPYARVGGALAGGMLPTMAARAVTPLPMNAARQDAVNTLQNEGVNALTAGQRTGSRPLQWFEQALSDMPMAGRGASNAAEMSAQQFTRAALQRVGENADRATPDVVDRAFTRIGNQFDTIAARNNITADGQLGQELRQVQNDYHFLANPMQRQVVDSALSDVVDVIHNNNGVLPGAQYQAMRSRLDKAARAASGSDNQLSDAMFGIKNALDDNMQRSLAAAGNPQDAQAWTTARRQYRDMLVIEKAATGAGENAANGLISPSQLRGAVVNQGRRAYARGQGDFADLARAGESVMRPLPQSGTAPRQNVQHMGAGLGAIIGGLAGGSHETAALGLAGLAGPSVLGRILMSRPAQSYLGNQLVRGPAAPTIPQNLLSAYLASVPKLLGSLTP